MVTLHTGACVCVCVYGGGELRRERERETERERERERERQRQRRRQRDRDSERDRVREIVREWDSWLLQKFGNVLLFSLCVLKRLGPANEKKALALSM